MKKKIGLTLKQESLAANNIMAYQLPPILKVDKSTLKCNKPRKTPSHKTKSHIVKACEGGKDDLGQPVEVADDEGERAYIEGLLEELRNCIITPIGPDQAGKGDVYDDQRRRQKGDLPTEQPETGVDVERESFENLLEAMREFKKMKEV